MPKNGTYSVRIVNLPEEKEKFLANKKYNPQFLYYEFFDPDVLRKYGRPQEKIAEYSKYLIDKYVSNYGNFSEITSYEGRLLTPKEIDSTIAKYTHDNNLEQKVKVLYLENMIARTAVGFEQDIFNLRIRIPVSYRQRSLQSVLDHEIGTHIFRMVNEIKQVWYKDKHEAGLLDHVETEEGLATLHFLLSYPVKIPLLQAAYYYAVFLAQKLSFAETFAELSKKIDDQDLVWFLTTRVKRGLRDTSKPGGYTKDIVYLAGAIKVSHWLAKNDFNSSNLYHGKIAIEDIEKCLLLEPGQPDLPDFVTKPWYPEILSSIIAANQLSSM